QPPQVAAPRADCGPGSRPEPSIQGRIPAGSDPAGFDCNLKLLSHAGQSGGFKTLRYVDEAGRECAFYDTALLFPTNATNLGGLSIGVKVLDMSDPMNPKETATLTEIPMLTPHESLTLNPKRGLLAAVAGNPATAPGLVSIYDASKDCRHPVLQSTTLSARLGHESGFAPDGKTFYATGTAFQAITAIDVTDPKAPHPIWQGNITSHGLTLSGDGNRAYATDPTGGQLVILDTSEIQARKPNPQAREIARLTWPNASIPQNAIRFSKDGRPYVLEFDEYTGGTTGGGSADSVGAARIIDIADETQPRVVSDLRLQVNQAADHAESAGDPGTLNPAQGYAAHYCNIPTQTDPTIVACSFIASGLRVFDISDLEQPKEVAYYVAPRAPQLENGFDGSNYAMSQPAFAPERREVWYTDGASGFNVLKLDERAWPAAAASTPPRTCVSRRRFNATLRVRKGTRIRKATATLGGKRIRVRRTSRNRRSATVRVALVGRVKSTVRLVIRARLTNGKVVRTVRTYHPCTRRGR
ncbi:MAG: hypothetical protein H0V81_10750, partial [Solirubrobacterales bacterium]|nr:hypothetical protein [Solirubrobacterales bacterium]